MARLAARLSLSLAGGALMAAAFPLGPPLPIPNVDGFWPAGWVCLAPVIVAAIRARGAWSAARGGLAAGVTAFGLIICWIDPFLIRWAGLTRIEAAAVSSLLVVYMALYVAIFALSVHLWTRRWGPGVACLLAPAGWCALEWARGTILTGFPWCLLGYSQTPAPAVIQVADLAGVYGVSFVLASSGALIAVLLDSLLPGAPDRGSSRRFAPGARAAVSTLAGVVVMALGYGAFRLGETLPPGEPIRAALVQANVAQSDKWDPAERLRIEEDHVAMTRRAAHGGASLVVWSESAVPVSITHDPGYVSRLESLARETGVDLVLGTVAYDRIGTEEIPYNSAVMVRPREGLTARYDKIHLVPFGEYVPLQKLLYFLEPLVHEASDFRPGQRVTLLQGEGPPLGTFICYEAIFPSLVRRFTSAGAAVLINLTNDAWYGDTAMPRQHLMHAAMRAVENRRPLLRCANTGVSALVDRWGRITARSALEETTILEIAVHPATDMTLYAASGDFLAALCAILAATSLAASRPLAKPGGRDAG